MRTNSEKRVAAARGRTASGSVSRRWRYWNTRSGSQVVKHEILALAREDRDSLLAQMIIVRQGGLRAASHLIGDIYEVEAHGVDNSYRLLFSPEGRKGRVLLAVLLLDKKTQKTPKRVIELAMARLKDWRSR